MNKKNNRKGFTIVELVIVIAVIAILATVLVPTFGEVIGNAQNSALVQELRNEYTSYTIKAGADVADEIVILLDGKYYTVTNGNPGEKPVGADTTDAEVVFNADGDVIMHKYVADDANTTDKNESCCTKDQDDACHIPTT